MNVQERKRLGQYFSGTALGRMLAALAQAEKAKTIIDPMVGSGDLLASCIEIGAKPELMGGVEIDRVAFDICQNRLPNMNCLLGNAFDSNVLTKLPTLAWDLVIANPPYVRYQSFSKQAAHELPNAVEIRADLLRVLRLLTALDDEDKRIFAHLVKGYSGLSDLAVPSWILCAGLVRQGGRLALVAPESWLSRDYATIVHYLLLRWFDIEFVIEDEHASWFEDAQVKTTLIIAKRVKRRVSAFAQPARATYCHVAISAAAANSDSPIGRLSLSGKEMEKDFAKQARHWRRHLSNHSTGLVRIQPVSLKRTCNNVIAAASRQKWFASLGEHEMGTAEGVYVPHEIHDWAARRTALPAFDTFESQGVAVGQGLRTGANGFFYADGERRGGNVALTFSGPLSGLMARAPSSIAKPVFRRQSELPSGFAVSARVVSSYVLDLRGYVLPEDVQANDLVPVSYERMPKEVAAVVNAAARANFGTLDKPQRVFELSAVSPNIRRATARVPVRYWYMLPDFAPRHLPDVFLARVNSATPRAYVNQGRECLIDANFSTMWTRTTSKWSANALLAFMNSAWARTVVECSGTVMGGGALKVEASHLRRFPVPVFNEGGLRKLDLLGARLAKADGTEQTIADIDHVIADALGCDAKGTDELKAIALTRRARRAKRKDKRGKDDGDEVR